MPLRNGAVTNSFSPSTSVDGSPIDTVHAIQSQALEIAVDRLNDIWYARKASSCTTCLVELPYIAGTPASWGGASTTGTGTAGVGAEQAGIVNANQLLFDAAGSVYLSNSGTATTQYVLPNTGTANAPTYAAQVTGTFEGLSLAQGAAGNGITAFDGSGNLWTSTAKSLVEFTPPFTNNQTGTTTIIQSYSNANASTPSITNPSTPYWGQVDGNGTLWYPSRTSSGQIWYSQLSNLTNSDYLYPCYAAAGATSCAASSTTTNETRMVQLDSTGAVWIVGQNAGYVTQLLGPGAPAWPQLSYAVYGTKPH